MFFLLEIFNVYLFELLGNFCWGFIIKDMREKNGMKMCFDYDLKI